MAATVTVVCPHCSNKMRASAEFIGKKGRCPSCRSLVEIAPSDADSARAHQPTSAGADVESSSGAAATSDVPGWKAGLIGAAATVALYLAIFWPIESTRLGQLFMHRGIIPYFITLLTCWGVALLVLKYIVVKRQLATAELELELIPLEIGLQVTPENVDQFLDHLVELPNSQQQSILGHRIQGALEHFKHRNSVPEVQEYLASQSDIDASAVDSGYTLLRAFIWAIPILGFIGTVMGIGEAVTQLSTTMKTTDQVASAPEEGVIDDVGEEPDLGSKMMTAMGGVTDGLSKAFDTTLVALVMAILLLFPTESLRKTEYDMLDRIQEFANESLLRRMVEKEKKSIGEAPGIVRDALESAFQEHQRWLAQWQAQVAELGHVIGSEFEAAVMNLQERIGQAEEQRVQNNAQVIEEMFAQIGQATGSWEQATAGIKQGMEISLDSSQRLNESLSRNAEMMTLLVEQHKELAEKYEIGDILQSMQEVRSDVAQLTERLGPVATSPSSEPDTEDLAPVDAVNNSEPTGFINRILGRNS